MDKSSFIAVVPPMAFETLWYPKRLMLMFDGLALDLNKKLSEYENFVLKKANHEVEWLSNQGLVTTLSGLFSTNTSEGNYSSKLKSEGSFFLPNDIRNDFDRFMDSAASYELVNNVSLRYSASELRKLQGIDAVAVSTPESNINIDKPVDRSTVISITLTEFPMPSDSEPWEKILEYKSDKSNRSKFQRLKVWMNKSSHREISANEYTDELRELIFEYEESLKLLKMKLQKGSFEVIIGTTVAIVENMARFKFSKVSKSLFRIQENHIKLLEEESNLKGREIAYIVDSNARFK